MRSDNGAPTALYRSIQAELRRKVVEAHWPVGSMLPSRRDLAREYKVSSLTIERAIDGLVREGLLRCDDRRGTFVATPGPSVAVVEAPREPAQGVVGIVASLYLVRHDHLELNNYWVRQLIQGIEGAYAEDGESTLFINRVQADGSVRSLKDSVAEAADRGVDGIAVIAFGQSPEEVDESLEVVTERNLPAVSVTAGPIRRPVPHVFLDGYDAGYQAAAHLLKQGCGEIMYLTPFEAWWGRQREEGVRAAMSHARLDESSLTVFPQCRNAWVNETDPETLGYEAACAAFSANQVPTGVICANDGVAFGLMRAAEERGRVVGQDLLMVGFDDHPDARARHLTSLRPSMEAMGTEAARLLRLALNRQHDSLQVRLRWRLIPRASTRQASGS